MRVQIVQIVAYAQYAALIAHMTVEGLFNAGFRERVQKDLPRGGAHAVFNRHQLASACLPGLKNFLIQLWMAACISARCPSKKCPAPSMITSSFGSGDSSTTFLMFSAGPYWSCAPLTNNLGQTQF